MARFVAQYVVGSGGRSYNLAFDPEAILVVNPTSKTVYVRFGALDVPNSTERADFFVLPRMAGVFPIKSPARSFAIGDGDPVVDPQPGEDGRCQIIVVAGEPIPALSPLPITYVRSDVTGTVNAAVTGTIDANVTNTSLPVVGSVDANITNSSLPVTGSVNANVTNTNLPVMVLNERIAVEVTNWPTQSGTEDPTAPPDGPTTISVKQVSWREWRPNDGKANTWTVNLNRTQTYQDVIVAVSMYPSFGGCRIRLGSQEYYYGAVSEPRVVLVRSFFQNTVDRVTVSIDRPADMIRAHAQVLFRSESSSTPPTLQFATFNTGSVTLTTSPQVLASTSSPTTTSSVQRLYGVIRFVVRITGTTDNFVRFDLKTNTYSSYNDIFYLPILDGTYTIYALTEPVADTVNPTINLYCRALNSPLTGTITVELLDASWQYFSAGTVTIGDISLSFSRTLNPGETFPTNPTTTSDAISGIGYLKTSREGWIKLTRGSDFASVVYATPQRLTPFPALSGSGKYFTFQYSNLNDYPISIRVGHQISV